MRMTPLLLVALLLANCGSPQEPRVGENMVAADAGIEVEASNEEKMWVTAERIHRHTCPSDECGIVGTLDFRAAAEVKEQKGDWVRVTRIYDASCVNGRSEYVDKGKAACVTENGIVDGKFGEWVQAKYLSATRPADPAATAAADEQLVKDSDDFKRYRRAFVKAARTLMDRDECTAADLQENGGFSKSSNHIDQPVYFTYCGGYTVANRIYLNAASGEIYR